MNYKIKILILAAYILLSMQNSWSQSADELKNNNYDEMNELLFQFMDEFTK